jgi:2-dehydropantoate 2-reductase
MQRDIKKGGQSEIDGLVYEVVRMADQYHLDLPVYSKIAGELKKNGLK